MFARSMMKSNNASAGASTITWKLRTFTASDMTRSPVEVTAGFITLAEYNESCHFLAYFIVPSSTSGRGPSMQRVDRLDLLARILRDRPGITIAVLANELSVSVRSVCRDIDHLRERGYPIEADR